MGVLVSKCPKTGKMFSTGIQPDARTVENLPQVLTHSKCPHCGSSAHSWRPRDAILSDDLPSSDWIENRYNKKYCVAFDRLGATEVRARVASKVYLGAERSLAAAWLERHNEAFQVEQLFIARSAAADARLANTKADTRNARASAAALLTSQSRVGLWPAGCHFGLAADTASSALTRPYPKSRPGVPRRFAVSIRILRT